MFNTNLPRPTFEQVLRPLLAAVFIISFWTVMPDSSSAVSEPYTGPITVRTYDFPQSEKDAVQACYATEREARGVPSGRNAYIEWWNTHKGTQAQIEWSAAFKACQDATLWQKGKWNWANMVLIKEEVHNG